MKVGIPMSGNCKTDFIMIYLFYFRLQQSYYIYRDDMEMMLNKIVPEVSAVLVRSYLAFFFCIAGPDNLLHFSVRRVYLIDIPAKVRMTW
jgi:hypothetical protein